MNWKYRKLKRHTVKILRTARKQGDLNSVFLLRTRTVFYLLAEKLGVDRNTAATDFDMEIRERVMR